MPAMIRIEGTIKALQPIIHSANTSDPGLLPRDNVRAHRKMKVNYEGIPVTVPVISGNSIRGILRRLGAEWLIRQLGLAPDHLSPKLYYLLFAGGALEKGDKKGRPKAGVNESSAIRPTALQELRKNLPLLSLLGCAYQVNMMESKLKVDFAVPYVDEVASLYGKPAPGKTANQITEWIHYSRMDQHDTEGTSNRMIFQYEYIVPGTEFIHGFTLIGTSELENSLFSHLLELFSGYGFLGGRSAQGHGKVCMNYASDHSTVPAMYVTHVQEHKTDIIEFMRTLWGDRL
ncbi:hypothetical protein SD71_04540 [Cohnella kolymensis]|uniref:CRISPR type III-associated protein domain-containing protein n=1 Tax=Cohnella kolymensis TaxID=1590652 RepID=A0ABR5A990_9BACL|nr:RAMP superfamily CRISPR-associated protein [Cohnella kolymensis]KIL36972.1 hypothetical protein SD71_04540 [Cohnella kolymensis]